MERHLQLAATCAFLALCVVGVVLGVRQLLLPVGPHGLAPIREPQPALSTYQPGDAISLRGVEFATSEHTLVLVIRKGCRFCEESMPFYQRLGDDASLAARVRIVVVAPDDEATSRAELARNRVRVDQIVQLQLNLLKVRGTPTAVLVGRTGVVERAWTGRLDNPGEQELIEVLKGTL